MKEFSFSEVLGSKLATVLNNKFHTLPFLISGTWAGQTPAFGEKHTPVSKN